MAVVNQGTYGTDDTALQAGLAALNPGDTWYWPAGVYYQTTQIVLPERVHWHGDGAMSTILHAGVVDDVAVRTVRTPTDDDGLMVRIHDLRITAKSATSTFPMVSPTSEVTLDKFATSASTGGLYIRGHFYTVERIKVDGFRRGPVNLGAPAGDPTDDRYGLRLESPVAVRVRDCMLLYNDCGVQVAKGYSTPVANSIDGCDIWSNRVVGVRVTDSLNTAIRDCTFQDNRAEYTIELHDAQHTKLTDLYLEGNCSGLEPADSRWQDSRDIYAWFDATAGRRKIFCDRIVTGAGTGPGPDGIAYPRYPIELAGQHDHTTLRDCSFGRGPQSPNTGLIGPSCDRTIVQGGYWGNGWDDRSATTIYIGGDNQPALRSRAAVEAPTPGPFNARIDGGAAGDGVTDDAAALQSSIDQAVATGRTLYIPAGTYRLNSALRVDGLALSILGDGQDATLLRTWYAGGDPLLWLNASGGGWRGTVEKLQIDGQHNACSTGIRLGRIATSSVGVNGVLRDVRVRRCETGIDCVSVQKGLLERVFCVENGTGMRIGPDVISTNTALRSCDFSHNTAEGLVIEYAWGINVDCCGFDGNGKEAIRIEASPPGARIKQIRIGGCTWIEGNNKDRGPGQWGQILIWSHSTQYCWVVISEVVFSINRAKGGDSSCHILADKDQRVILENDLPSLGSDILLDHLDRTRDGNKIHWRGRGPRIVDRQGERWELRVRHGQLGSPKLVKPPHG